MNNYTGPLLESLSIGIIQTTLDYEAAWSKSPRISASQDNHAWHEIRRAVRALSNHEEQPKIILLPELALPRTRLVDFERMMWSLNAIGIVGVDYRLDYSKHEIRNEGLIVVPRNLGKSRSSRFGSRVWFGKHVPAPAEESSFPRYSPPWSFVGDPNVYIFDAGPYGRIGVSICYDFMDIERALIYRGKIHHLIVIAYNKDVKLFESLAVSLSRTVFCNVIVCNTGHFGGSLLVSPFHDAHKRIGYSVQGGETFTSQCVKLCVKELDEAIHEKSAAKIYKHLPPGYSSDF
ncbi:hypothetical protein LF844_10395 [Metapseudomonas lalkuanensis]|uniref:hypothetical protein n=1 Tax=Metapseudomonas lalkuanensis TaxID=2604832 RepID=UPI001CF371F6|nr:hypothetical protein [Pseudomonas lalkuanensis]UCP00192.1 hypothetical protein LF844_10395 [Pseudomonas lalkuanensis]